MSRHPVPLVAFVLDGRPHALPLAAVERVIHAVEVTPLPGAPAGVLGAIDLGGRLLPVYCLRPCLHGAKRPVHPSDQLLVARSAKRVVALLVDEVQGVVESTEPPVALDRVVPGAAPANALVQLRDGLSLIVDLEAFLSPQEERALDAALGARA